MDIYFGADVGGTQIKLGAYDPKGELIKKWSIDTDKQDNGNRIIPGFLKEIIGFMDSTQYRDSSIAGIGIGVPGPVNDRGLVRQCPNLFWRDFSPSKECINHLKAMGRYHEGLKVEAANDANVAALGEYYYGAGKDYTSIALLTIGTGIGCGVVINGDILYGAKGMAGEPGHIALAPELVEKPCNCGNTGCVEQLASATGIVNYMNILLRDDPAASNSLLYNKTSVTARDVCDAAKEGDTLALKCLKVTMGVLGRAMSILSHIVDPDAFIIGGGVSKAGDILIDPMMEEYKKYLYLSDDMPVIILATLGNDAGIAGAARLVLDLDK